MERFKYNRIIVSFAEEYADNGSMNYLIIDPPSPREK